MARITIGPIADETPVRPSWDTVWIADAASGVGGWGDWALAASDETGNIGGFQSTSPLETAILIQLFSDRRLVDGQEPPEGFDRGGWHGDSFDIDTAAGESLIGSRLWTLDRAPPNRETADLARHYAAEALQTLIDQGAVGSFDIEAEADPASGSLLLGIKAYAPDDGQLIYAGSLPLR